MFKNLRSKIFGDESVNITKKSDLNAIKKNSMSYSREKTCIAGHDMKLSRTQWENGLITDEHFFNTKKLDYKIFDSNVLEKMYPSCTKEQIK